MTAAMDDAIFSDGFAEQGPHDGPVAWAERFLRQRCAALEGVLAGPMVADEGEADSIEVWLRLFWAAGDLPDPAREALEALQAVHARVAGRAERGGLDDICGRLEQQVRTHLVGELRRRTDEALLALA